MDRLSKKNKVKTGGSAKTSGVSIEALEKALAHLKLKCSADSEKPVWTRDYAGQAPSCWADLPSLQGFFPRAGEADPKPEEILFLDTETTGLSGGTGTIAFLVGVGWLENENFHSRQFFLPDFNHEGAMLEALAKLAGGFKVVMTFNGASFDLPLLRTRALMNRLKDPCRQLVSWDLLVPGRRLWSRVLPNCRQQTLEESLLGVRRGSSDIEGALIPQTWFDFLKTGDGEMITRVLHHNQRDLVGMVGIFSRVLDMAGRLQDGDERMSSWQEAWALGCIAEKAGLREDAADWMQRAVVDGKSGSVNRFIQPRFVTDAIRLLKRQRNWRRVEVVIEKALVAGMDEPWLHREAAILYEHRIDCPVKAMTHARLCNEPARVLRLEKKSNKLKR